MKSTLLVASFLLIAPLASAGPAVDKAVADAGIHPSDPLEVKIDKALILLTEKRYFAPKIPLEKLPAPYTTPYELDSMRTPEEILAQRIGGSCGSSALAFAALLGASGVPIDDIQREWAHRLSELVTA